MSSFAALLTLLDSAPFSIAGAPVAWSEILGALTGIACVWLLTRQNVWTWPLGLANNVFWALLFFRAKLYADSVLQLVFFALGCYGWWRWLHPLASGEVVRVRRTTRREWLAFGALLIASTSFVAWVLANRTDSPAPIADASVLTLSLVATWGQAQKLYESWWVWILVDVISVPLYLSRALYPTAVIYSLFGLLCVKGLVAWRRDLARSGEAA